MMFTVPGEIRGKARPRFTKVGRAYTDAKTKAYERKIAAAFKAAGGKSLGDKPVKLFVLALYPVPKSEKKTNKLLMWLSILLDIGAAITNACHKEYKMTIYWLAAAVLNAAVTF